MTERYREAPSPQRPTLLGKLREELAVRHYARRTVKSYVLWARRYLAFHGCRHPREMGSKEIQSFLSHLAVASRQVVEIPRSSTGVAGAA